MVRLYSLLIEFVSAQHLIIVVPLQRHLFVIL